MNYRNEPLALYVGRTKGDGVNVQSRLLDHLQNNHCPAVTRFGSKIYTTKKEAEDLEVKEIK